MLPIQTFYNNYHFRSRLEARWAVFFDSEGWKYNYELEGFDLDGIRYLPDFYLPDLDAWVEVKGQLDDTEAMCKLAKLCRHTKKNGLYLEGEINANMKFTMMKYIASVGEVSWESATFHIDRNESLIRARSARFEHGEKG